jgi:hypothetical protein
VSATVEPTPSGEELEAILAALGSARVPEAESGWAAAALLEGVDESEPEQP